MDSLGDLLSGKQPQQPPEIRPIKAYVRREFNSDVEVVVRERDIVITSRSSALTGTLRMRTRELQQAAGTSKRLVFRTV